MTFNSPYNNFNGSAGEVEPRNLELALYSIRNLKTLSLSKIAGEQVSTWLVSSIANLLRKIAHIKG